MSTLNKTLYRALLVRLITASAGIGIGVCNANAQSFFRVQVEETDRTAVVHGLKKGAHPRPLVIVLHGFSASADSTRSSFGMDVIADREDFVVAYPDGFGRTWNYGIPIGKGEIKPQAGGKTVDDIAFLKALIERLAKTGQIDRSRIYLTGVSYGGMMAFAVACALSREIAAVAPLITGMSEQQRADCRPERALPMAVVAGTKDTV